MIALMLEEFVETLGHHVRAIASTVSDACDAVRAGGFDFAILDCHISGEEVWPVADLLEQAGVPYILSSGGSISEVPAPYSRRPMMAKPYTIGTVSDFLSSGAPAGG